MLGWLGGAPTGNYTTVVNCLILTLTNPIHNLPPISLTPSLILFSTLFLYLQNGVYLSSFPIKTLNASHLFLTRAICLAYLHKFGCLYSV